MIILKWYRAKFGLDRVRNAVHCTDLQEDGVIECEYFFNILQENWWLDSSERMNLYLIYIINLKELKEIKLYLSVYKLFINIKSK